MKRVLLFACLLVVQLYKSYAQPVNDNCSGAIAINIPATGVACITDSTEGATSTTWPSAVCGQTTWTHDVWFTFIATGAENAIIVQPTGSPGAVQLGLSVYSGTCGNLTGNGTYCSTTALTNGSDTVIQLGAPGTQYWVEVSAFGGDGSFNLCVTSSTPPAAPGTSCATAASICTEAPFILTSAPVGSTAFTPDCFQFNANQSYWYEFTAGSTGLLAWAATPLSPNTELDFAVYDITTGCANLTPASAALACNYHFANYVSAPTGMSDTSTTPCPVSATTNQGAWLEMCPSQTITAGHTYAIFIENYANNQSGWAFNWNGSTFQMAPTSSFTATPGTACGNTGTITLINNSVAAATQTWNFGDGTTSTAANPGTHTYNAAGTYIITLTVASASGCSNVSTQSVIISPQPTLAVNNPPVCTGQPDTLTAIPSITGGTYSWSPGGATTSSVIVTLATTTTYTVTYTSPYGCSVTATNTATLDANHFSVNAGDDTSVCAYLDVKLNGSVTPAAGTYTYQWTPAATLTGATTLTPTASTGGTTIYQLAVTDTARCTYTDTMTVGITGVPIPVNATVAPSIICPGQQVQLNANVLPTGCGLTVPCSGNTNSPVLGNGTTLQPGGGTTFPTLLGNYDHSGRNQMLYQAAEITPVLGGACTINTLYFDIQAFNSNAYLQDFTISMACTDSTSISTWDNSLSVVYNAADYQPTPGWNQFSLNTPFAWDGSSNLIIDICWYDPATFGNQNNKAVCTTTAFNSYLNLYSNTVDLCGTTLSPTVSVLRPNVKFSYCVPNINNYTIAWTPSTGANEVSNPAIANPTANPINGTLYTIHVGGTGGCGGQDTVRVLVDTSKVTISGDTSICPGSSNTLTAVLTGAPIPGPPVYTWSTLGGAPFATGTSVTVNPTVNTTYILTMTGGACTKADTLTVKITGLTVTLVDSMVSCNGGDNGKILASANGTAPYTYVWHPAVGSINPDINLTAGNYSVTMTDPSGCSGSASTTITQPANALSVSSETANGVTCFGGNDGSIIMHYTGGTSPYSFQWSNGLPPDSTVTGLTANTYTVTVTDAHGCTLTNAIPVTQPAAITFGAATITEVLCLHESTGQITVSPTGGAGAPYTYSWSQNINLNSPTASNLAAGNYTVTATDGLGCTGSQTNTITQPATGITFSAFDTTATTCFDGSNGTATVNVTGGTMPYGYLWNPGGQTTKQATGLTAGAYTVTVTDGGSCSASASVTVVQPPQIQLSGTVINDSCNGNSNGSVTQVVTNGVMPFTFSWSNTAQTTQNITNLAANNYSVTITDRNGCTQTATYTVTEPPVLAVNPTVTEVKCLGASTGAIAANASGGTSPYTYNWSPSGSTATISNLPAGNYGLTVTDHFGCTATATEQITQPATGPAFGAATIINDSCNGGSDGSIVVTVSGGTGGYTYNWSQNPQLHISAATGLPAGIDTVTATDANGCSVSQIDTVTQPLPITFGPQTITNVTCNGQTDGAAQITPTGGTGNYSYTWNGTPGPNPNSNLAAGTYTVVVSDQYGCKFSTTVVITEPPVLGAYPITQEVKCYGGSDGSIVEVPGGGTPPYTYLWSTGATTDSIGGLSVLPNGQTYNCTITDAAGCGRIAYNPLTQPTQLGDTHDSTQVSCPGEANGTISVYAYGGTPPYSYAVTQDGVDFVYSTTNVIDSLAAGLYAILISDSNGCTIEDTARVLSPIPDSFSMVVTPTSCYGSQYQDGSITVTGLVAHNAPFQYSIDSGQLQNNNVFTGLSAGPHVIDAFNQFGCETVLDTTVPSPVQGYASVMPKDTTLKLGESIQLSSAFVPFPASSITSYLWTPSVGLSCIDCPDPIVTTYNHVNQYTLIITYNDICTASDSMTIYIINNNQVFIPNAFTPNNDGNNDVFEIYGNGIKTVLLQVFNRWGEKVFESTDQFNGWDGTFKGILQDPGVFVYHAQINFLDNTQIEKSGSVTLIR